MRWQTVGLALLVIAGAAAHGPAVGFAQQQTDTGAVLTGVALTEADLPAGLALDEGRSGLRTGEEGTRTYLATFVGNGRGPLPIMGVVNIVSESPDAAGIDRLTDRFRTGLGGTPTDLAAPGIGEASRAFTVTTPMMGGAMTASTVFVATRRAGIVSGVAVTSLGDTPQTDEALRLAQAVDQRLVAALRSGT
jgi:hypothetical protein